MRTVRIITGSAKKFKEMAAFFSDVPGMQFEQLDLDLVEIQELDAKKIMEHKLREAAKRVTGEFLVDDTSFYVEALNGFPGPLVKWMRLKVGEPKMWDLVSRFDDHRARASTLIGYGNTSLDPPLFKYFEGYADGEIVSPGPDGYGFDIIFIPDGHTKRFSEMTVEEKNACSHRGKALEKAKEFLEKQLND